MKIRCRHCEEFFNPDDETVDFLSEGYISGDTVNYCDNCWYLLEHSQEDISELPNEADMGF